MLPTYISPLSVINHSKYGIGSLTNLRHILFHDTNSINHNLIPIITFNKNQKLHYSIIETVKLNNNKDMSKYYYIFFFFLIIFFLK